MHSPHDGRVVMVVRVIDVMRLCTVKHSLCIHTSGLPIKITGPIVLHVLLHVSMKMMLLQPL